MPILIFGKPMPMLIWASAEIIDQINIPHIIHTQLMFFINHSLWNSPFLEIFPHPHIILGNGGHDSNGKFIGSKRLACSPVMS
jgi:hypothetical protein